ncbi:MAG: formylglycine-generating enzyme family protein, partial [Deltaproteobacteria bacterium]|nr:formylglycine-generating enzyme family protein [Deltaproteobacteria bacterium]
MKKANLLIAAVILAGSIFLSGQAYGQEKQEQTPHPETKQIGGIKFVKLPGGSFLMGSPENAERDDEKPRHRVTLDPFYIGVYEVTQKQYRDVTGENPSRLKGDNLPVENVSWPDAMEFCRKFSEKNKVKARLPYEAEWEYAARAGSTTPYHWG